jgi:hypothetical protein
MIPAHYTESKIVPATQGRIAFLPAWIRATAAMQRFGRYQRKNGLVLDIVNVSSLTLFDTCDPGLIAAQYNE